MIRRLHPALVILGIALVAKPLAAQDGQVVFERTGYRLTSLGGRVSVAARVLDARRRAVPNAPIAWRVEDSAVAVVDRRGVVQSKRVGRTRLWAVSGRDSASALILVDQWASRFAFSPAVVSFAAIGGTRTVQVQARDASNNAIPDIRLATACRILDPRIASLQSDGQITAIASGETWLRCADRGVADSARIEVRQRAASATILDKTFFAQPRVVGDSFQIRMRAVDAQNNPITAVRPTFTSLEPRVVNVDPLTGWGRGIAPGASRVVAQIGDITDTVDINVINGAGMNLATIAPAGGATESAASAATASLSILPSLTGVGDTTNITILPREATGRLADAATVTLRLSGDTSIARLTPDRRLVGLKEGPIWIVGTFGDLVDSSRADIRPRGSIRSEAVAENFIRPSYDTAAARERNRMQVDTAMRSILAGSSVRVSTGRMISAQGLLAQAAHSAKLGENNLERRRGILFGGRLIAAPFAKLQASADLRVGSLTADASTPLAEDMKMAEVDGMLTFLPAQWISLEGGWTMRTMSTPLAAQRWSFATASVQFHPSLIGDRFTTVFGFSVLPTGSLRESDTTSTSFDPSFAGDAGLEFRTGRFTAALLYHSERISFPITNGVKREDRFSMLRVRLGYQLGQ